MCEKECLTKGSLRQHMKDHNMEHSICKYCEKTFPLKRYLQEHIVRTHRERKFFQCTVCPSKLKTRQALERHEQVQHNSSATHKIDCTVCGKSFIGRNTIKVHMKKHMSAQKNEKCQLCPLGFSDKTRLKGHMKSVHFNNVPFLCQICQRTVHHLVICRSTKGPSTHIKYKNVPFVRLHLNHQAVYRTTLKMFTKI